MHLLINSSTQQILQKSIYKAYVKLQLQKKEKTMKNPYFVLGKFYFSLNKKANVTYVIQGQVGV